jgi:hypothetical protein
LKYDNTNSDLSILRFNCISSIYGIADKTKSLFTLLRNDHENHGITSLDIKIIQMMREGPVDPDDVAQELSMTRENAKKLISSVSGKLEENSRLGARVFRGFPTVEIGPNFALVSTVTNLDRSSMYVDLLRYVLTTESEELNKICPPRLQKVEVESAVIKTTEDLGDAVENEYDDLFGESAVEEAPNEEEESIAETTSDTLVATSKQVTNYGYFHGKLQDFDPETFPEKSLYPKKCNLKHQPVVLTNKDKKELADSTNKNKGEGKFDPYKNLSEDKRLDTENPDGTFICPEYWCMKNEIPLREEDLVVDEEGAHCPVCMGKLQTGMNVDVRQYPSYTFNVAASNNLNSNDRFELVFSPTAVTEVKPSVNGTAVFSIYPNPSNGSKVVASMIGFDEEKVVVTVVDMLGKVVYTSEQMISADRNAEHAVLLLLAGCLIV